MSELRRGALPIVQTTRQPGASETSVRRFAAAWSALGGRVQWASPQDVVASVIAAVDGRSPVLVDTRSSMARQLDLNVSTLHWPECGLNAGALAQVGVIEATAAIADTGTIVVDSAKGGRCVSLLPPVAVFVVEETTVVKHTGDVLRRPATWWPEALPSQIVLVTGPSRSADIEMSLAVGVHGPGEVHVVIVSA